MPFVTKKMLLIKYFIDDIFLISTLAPMLLSTITTTIITTTITTTTIIITTITKI